MKSIHYLVPIMGLFFFTVFAACKKNTDSGAATSGNSAVKIAEVLSTLDTIKQQFYAFNKSTGIPSLSMAKTIDWMKTLPTVANAYLQADSVTIYFTTKSGLMSSMSLMIMGDDSIPLTRGGTGGTSGLKLLGGSGGCSNPMENKKVLIWAAEGTKGKGYREQGFYKPGQLQALVSSITKTAKDIQVTLLENQACTPETIESFKDYGMVIIDTHGLNVGFMAGTRFSFDGTKPYATDELEKAVMIKVGKLTYDKILTGKLWIDGVVTARKSGLQWNSDGTDIDGGYRIIIHSTYVESLPAMPSTIIFGNMCYSGNAMPDRFQVGTPIRNAFVGKNPIAYYGYAKGNNYSSPVANAFAIQMEGNIVNRLFSRGDSTRVAHLAADNKSEFEDANYPGLALKLFGRDTYCYGCGPVLTDDRDGEQYQVACIGDQKWMAENLRFNVPGSAVANGDNANLKTHGRLYSAEMMMAGQGYSDKVPSGVQGICPKGWHVPSAGEWDQMIATAGGLTIAGGRLKASTGWPTPNSSTDDYGFKGLPSGTYDASGGYLGFNNRSTFRSSSTVGVDAVWTYGLSSFSTAVSKTNYNVYADPNKKIPWMVSCRCVMDK